MKSGTGQDRDTLDRLYCYYSVGAFTSRLEDAGLLVTDVETYDSVGFDNNPCGVVAVFGRRPA